MARNRRYTAANPPTANPPRMDVAQLFGHLIYPIFQTALLAALGVLLLCLKRFRSGVALLVIAFAWIGLCATPAFALWLQGHLESPFPVQPATAYPKADAIVVLGGGSLPESGIDWSNDDFIMQVTRLGFGLRLFQNGRANVILVSGGDQAQRMAHKLHEQGVPTAALQAEDTSADTHQNAAYSAAILKRENLQHILLVTSGIHMPRAYACFVKQGLTVTPAPASDPDHPSWHASPWLPRRAALRLTGRCIREYIGLWVYRLRGWA